MLSFTQTTVPLTTAPEFDLASCPHDRGPGITVCLRCRADAHRKAAAARRRIAMQLGIATVVIGVAIVGGSNMLAARPGAGRATTVSQAGSVASGGTETFSVASAGAEETKPAAPAGQPAAALAPVIGAGHTDLGDSIFADRSGDSVIVHFDTPVLRTRRRDKFEQVVRTTLPLVYGAYADSVLAGIPMGTIAGSGDLLTELPERGISLPSHGGMTLTLWPGLRPGHDGPLVVSYRIAAARAR